MKIKKINDYVLFLILFSLSTNAHATGQDTYKQYCAVCHAAGLAGAPKFRDAKDWAPHTSHSMDHMLYNAITGINAMPPKGTCTTCTDEQIKEAIEYMLPQ